MAQSVQVTEAWFSAARRIADAPSEEDWDQRARDEDRHLLLAAAAAIAAATIDFRTGTETLEGIDAAAGVLGASALLLEVGVITRTIGELVEPGPNGPKYDELLPGPAVGMEPGFDELWLSYLPGRSKGKGSKAEAKKKFLKLTMNRPGLAATMLAAVRDQVAGGWRQFNGYAPQMTRWLNNRMWEDGAEPSPAEAASEKAEAVLSQTDRILASMRRGKK